MRERRMGGGSGGEWGEGKRERGSGVRGRGKGEWGEGKRERGVG